MPLSCFPGNQVPPAKLIACVGVKPLKLVDSGFSNHRHNYMFAYSELGCALVRADADSALLSGSEIRSLVVCQPAGDATREICRCRPSRSEIGRAHV